MSGRNTGLYCVCADARHIAVGLMQLLEGRAVYLQVYANVLHFTFFSCALRFNWWRAVKCVLQICACAWTAVTVFTRSATGRLVVCIALDCWHDRAPPTAVNPVHISANRSGGRYNCESVQISESAYESESMKCKTAELIPAVPSSQQFSIQLVII